MLGSLVRGRLVATSAALSMLLFACDSGESGGDEPGCIGSSCTIDGSTLSPTFDGGTTTVKEGGVVNSAGPTLPCEVQKIVTDKCGLCHGDPAQFGAYMPLATHAQFHAPGTTDKTKKYFELAKTRINATSGAMPPPTAAKQLSTEERATLNAWLDKGAPAGEACNTSADGGTDADGGLTSDGGSGSPDASVINTDGLTCYQFLARGSDMKSPFKVGAVKDGYFNIRFTAPWQGTAYGIVIRPIINNSKIIHHWLLFQDNDLFPGPATGPVQTNGAHPNGQLLAGWAPGTDPIDTRESGADVGIELPPTTYTVEFHYNSTDPTATDASGVEVCVSKTKPANIAALSWLGFENWSTAPGWYGEPRDYWKGTCKPTAQQPINIISVWPHMHLQGTHMKATITRKSGTKEVLHDKPFEFEYQRIYKKSVTLQPGDAITTECSYKTPTLFGQGTEAEMCYLFTLAYPKGALADGAFYGRTAHGASACLGQ